MYLFLPSFDSLYFPSIRRFFIAFHVKAKETHIRIFKPFFFFLGSPNSRSYFLSPNSLAAVVDGANNKNLFVRGRLEDFVLLKNKLASCCQRVVAMQNVQSMLQKQRQVTGKQVNCISTLSLSLSSA